jgi:hypothetical protein
MEFEISAAGLDGKQFRKGFQHRDSESMSNDLVGGYLTLGTCGPQNFIKQSTGVRQKNSILLHNNLMKKLCESICV